MLILLVCDNIPLTQGWNYTKVHSPQHFHQSMPVSSNNLLFDFKVGFCNLLGGGKIMLRGKFHFIKPFLVVFVTSHLKEEMRPTVGSWRLEEMRIKDINHLARAIISEKVTIKCGETLGWGLKCGRGEGGVARKNSARPPLMGSLTLPKCWCWK